TKFTITSSAVPETPLAGNLDAIAVDGTRAVFSGWSVDPADPSKASDVAVKIGSTTVVTQAANIPRQDVDAAFGYGPNHGFEIGVTFATGNHNVCVVALPLSGGGERELGCRTLSITASNAPVGNLDAVQLVSERLVVSGWALDWDNLGQRSQIEVSVDGAVTRHTADRTRSDVATALGAGPNHGFRIVLDAPPGQHRVCVTAIDTSPGTVHTSLGCRTFGVGAPASRAPIGSLDAVRPTTEAILVSGWAVDPDEPTAAAQVEVSVDGAAPVLVAADRTRNDVHAAFNLGANHGFKHELQVAPGSHTVCVVARDVAPGTTHTPLGCRTVDVPAAQVVSSAPVATLDRVTGGQGTITIAGWAFDPDATANISVRVTVDGMPAGTFVADRPRADVASAHGVGPTHGFRIDLDATGGSHEVCVEAIDVAPGTNNTALDCRDVQVSAFAPQGYVDRAAPEGAHIAVEGWVGDRDVDGPISVEVFVDGVWAGRWRSSLPRPDVASATGLGADVGFQLRLPATPGTHEVCVYAVDPVPGVDNLRLSCHDVSIS
ncbi:MAG: hypothetical protein KDB21_03275, partial [Acidimicrobiales bacterium]|nr:hypothetical protein [Acidimicrobiales bacterium]